MTSSNERETLEQNVSSHVFSASASLVGISLTCLGLFRISDKLKNFSTFANEILAIDALLFLVACLLSYLCLRKAFKARTRRIEQVAEWIFLSAVSLMVVICGLIAYEFL